MKCKEKWPHQDEEWTHKDGSGLVTVDAMFENDTFYIRADSRLTCRTIEFKRNYIKK